MKNYLIAERYAHGLSLVLEDDAQLEPAVEALKEVAKTFESLRDFRTALSNPAIPKKERSAALAASLEGQSIPSPVERLLDVLMMRGRIGILPDVAKIFSTLADDRLGRVRAKVTSAASLDEAQRARLSGALQKRSGKDVRLVCVVDPDILGGAVAEVGGAVLDGSVRTQLERLRSLLHEEESTEA